MKNPHEENIRIEMSYSLDKLEIYQRVKDSIEVKYPGVEVNGKETERSGSQVLITLAFVPKSRNAEASKEIKSGAKVYESTSTALVHDFVSGLIEEYCEEHRMICDA